LESLVLIKIILIVILLCFSAFFSGSETALFSLGSVKLFKFKESKHPKESLVYKLLENPRRLLISILVGNECINISASALAASLCISLVGFQGKWIAIAIMTPLILFFGEVLPKTIAVSYNEKFSFFVARPLDFFSRVIFPLRWAIGRIVDAILALFSASYEKQSTIFYERELKDLIDAGHKDGVLEEEERALIHNILKFNDTPVFSIMTPYSIMFTMPHDLSIDQAIKQAKKHPFSRIPVYEKEKNDIVGILNVKDLLTMHFKPDGKTASIGSVLRPPYFVPQDKRIHVVLKEFQEKKIHLALVVNRAGKVVGLITIEDVLEELFGEIYDEFDAVIKRKK
jgi:putative hemolysin